MEGQASSKEPELGPKLGDIATNNKGKTGIFQGFETNENGEYARIRFADHDSLLPVARFRELYTLMPSAQFAPVGTDIEQQLKYQEENRKRKISEDTLKDYIERYQTYSYEDLGLIASPEHETNIRVILDEAKQKGFVFRGDGRSPYANGAYDRVNHITQGIFEDGFRGDTALHQHDTHLTADITRALEYPRDDVMSTGWDRRKYLYFIDPEVLYKNIPNLNLSTLDNNEILSQAIDAEYIPYAIEYRDNTIGFAVRINRRVFEVFKNENVQ